MMSPVVYFVIVAVLVGLWGVTVYNRLVRFRARREEGWSGVLVQLKRRHDLIPNLVATAKGLAGHEKDLMMSVTQARAAQGGASVADVASAENALTSALGRFLAIAENYPQIKADAAFTQLMGDLSKVEDDVQLARRYYNGTVREYNVAVQSLRDIVDFMRKHEDHFPEFRASRTYKLFEPPIFENKKQYHGYWF